MHSTKEQVRYFYIPTQPSIIPRSPPAMNDVYYPGDLVPIRMGTVANFDPTSKVTVRFRRARVSKITDAILDTFIVVGQQLIRYELHYFFFTG